jgi:outer membrane protein assembly complex protein YaeT
MVAIAALFAIALPANGADEDQPPIIANVRVVASGPINEEEILEVLELEPGRRIDPARLREVISTLYAAAEVEWLRIESRESEGGIDVQVRLSLRSIISNVKIRTGNPFLLVRVARWLQLERGDPVTAAGVEAARRRVERRLNDRGFADARVDAYINYDRPTNEVEVEIEVAPGPPQRLGSIEIEGLDDTIEPDTAQPKYSQGKKLTTRLEDRLRERTENKLRSMGFWEAEVLDVDKRGDNSTIELALRVESGPRYTLDLEAPEDRLKAARASLPDPERGDLHPEQTEALAETVEEQLQEVGFLLAAVDAELGIQDGERVLKLAVDPGDKLKIGAVEFPGADFLTLKELTAAVRVKKGGAGGRFGQVVSNATLDNDRLAIQEAYHQQGFPFVVVGTPELIRMEDKPAVRVVFPVEEGMRWLMEEVRVEGLPVESAADLDTRPLQLTQGSPWSPGAVERAQQRLEEALHDTGYPEGAVDVEVDTSTEGKAVATFRIESGPFVRIGDVVIAGLVRTREGLVRGVVRRAGVRTGEPMSKRRMLAAQRGLFELGLFRKVELVPMPGQERRPDRSIVVRIDEGEQRSYLLGVGYSDRDAARVTLGWSHLNLLGRGYAFSAETALSSVQQRFSISLRKRRAFGLPLPGYLVIYNTDEIVAERKLNRRGLWIDLGDRLKRPLRPWLRYEYEIIQPEDVPFVTTQQDDFEFQESFVASLTPSVEWDTRDNPLAPTRGVFASASLQYAFPAFQADNHFLKFRTGGTIYSPVGGGFGSAGLRIGAATPIGGSSQIPENLQIPFAYRFFAGGRTSHRAYDVDRLGIPGQTLIDDIPLGGNALFLLNLEYRHQVWGQFFAAAFVDAGNVWATPGDVRLDDIRIGPGIGLHYMTPAGPLRAEFAWKLDPLPSEAPSQFYISFGVPF